MSQQKNGTILQPSDGTSNKQNNSLFSGIILFHRWRSKEHHHILPEQSCGQMTEAGFDFQLVHTAEVPFDDPTSRQFVRATGGLHRRGAWWVETECERGGQFKSGLVVHFKSLLSNL